MGTDRSKTATAERLVTAVETADRLEPLVNDPSVQRYFDEREKQLLDALFSSPPGPLRDDLHSSVRMLRDFRHHLQTLVTQKAHAIRKLGEING